MRALTHALCLAVFVVSALLAPAASAADALDTRVTIAFSNASAAEVIRNLAAAAGLTADVAPGTMRPVTITLTNVRLGTALNAVCENAMCTWKLVGPLKVTPLPNEASAQLPSRVSFSLEDVPPVDAFRALGAAIGVPVTIEPALPNDPITIRFKDAPAPEVLNTLCEIAQCAWTFDPQRGLRVTAKR